MVIGNYIKMILWILMLIFNFDKIDIDKLQDRESGYVAESEDYGSIQEQINSRLSELGYYADKFTTNEDETKWTAYCYNEAGVLEYTIIVDIKSEIGDVYWKDTVSLGQIEIPIEIPEDDGLSVDWNMEEWGAPVQALPLDIVESFSTQMGVPYYEIEGGYSLSCNAYSIIINMEENLIYYYMPNTDNWSCIFVPYCEQPLIGHLDEPLLGMMSLEDVELAVEEWIGRVDYSELNAWDATSFTIEYAIDNYKGYVINGSLKTGLAEIGYYDSNQSFDNIEKALMDVYNGHLEFIPEGYFLGLQGPTSLHESETGREYTTQEFLETFVFLWGDVWLNYFEIASDTDHEMVLKLRDYTETEYDPAPEIVCYKKSGMAIEYAHGREYGATEQYFIQYYVD